MSPDELDLIFWNLLPAILLGGGYVAWKVWTSYKERAAEKAAQLEREERRRNAPLKRKKPNHRHGRP